MTNDMKKVCSDLTRLRRTHGADTPIGHRASNILEMLDAGTALPSDIARQVRELGSLLSKGRYDGKDC